MTGVDIGSVVIIKSIAPDGEITIGYQASDDLPLADILGMLTFTAHALTADRMERPEG